MDSVTLTVIAEPHIRMALQEDITSGDVSTMSVMPHAGRGTVELISKQDGVIAGLDVFQRVFTLLDSTTSCTYDVQDGDRVVSGQHLATIEADVCALLSGERTALNYLQRMSGIASATRAAVDLLEAEGSLTRVVDTRKTTPGMRIFEKEAVRIGGGTNHRFNLSDGVLLKDNHIAAAGGVAAAIQAARVHAPFVRKIEVECETLDQVREALDAGADIIMLDNMSVSVMQQALDIIQGRAETECSGNVDLASLPRIAKLGVTYVSSGALTHSAGILDLSLKHLRVID